MNRTLGAIAAVGLAGLAGGALDAQAVSAPTCSAASLGAWAGSTQGAAGTLLTEFAFVNKGARACSLIGYPRVQMESAAGKPIATTDEDASGFLGLRRVLVVIAPGKRAYFGVAYPDSTGAGQRRCPTAAELELTPPGSSAPVLLTGSGAAITPYAGSNRKLGCGVVEPTYVTATRFQ
ncbi:MAG: DUF4232 domain-containing protein [Solirubrobacteraceae bacterium]